MPSKIAHYTHGPGWSVWEKDGCWSWVTCGPCGGETGHGADREDAIQQAKKAAKSLGNRYLCGLPPSAFS